MMIRGYKRFAEALVFVHGAAAKDEAAKQALLCESLGLHKTADHWRHVNTVLVGKFHGPHTAPQSPSISDCKTAICA